MVTGGTGYIGSNLVRNLVAKGHEVHLIVRETSRFNYLEDCIKMAHLFVYDGKIEKLIQYFQKVKPTVTIHFASLFLSEHNEKNLNDLLNSNIIFGTEVLEAMRQSGCRKLINTGSYWQHYDDELYNPVCLYAATKQAFYDLIYYYSQAYEMQSITLELFDSYGPRDERSKILNILKKHMDKDEVLSVTPGEQLMDLVYIDDIINAYLIAMKKLEGTNQGGCENYVISSGNRLSLKELVNQIEQITLVKLHLQWGGRDYRYREVMIPYTQGKLLPGWEPRVSLVEGLKCFFEVN